jgi:hypothetical protein
MSVLIFCDSPFMNFKHTNIAYDLILNLTQQYENVFYFVNNFSTNNDGDNFFVLNLDTVFESFHKDLINKLNTLPNSLKYIHQEELKQFHKVKFIVKNKKEILDQEMLNEVVDSIKPIQIYYSACFGAKVIDEINFHFTNLRKTLYYEIPTIPMCKNHERLVNQFDEIIINNKMLYKQMKEHFPNKVLHYLNYQINCIDKFNFKLFPKNMSNKDKFKIKYNNRITHKLPFNKKVFLIEIDGYDIASQEIKLLDLYFRLLYKLNKDYPDKFFFVFNLPDDFIFQNIFKIFTEKKKDKLDKNSYTFVMDYFGMNGFYWKYKYINLVSAVDGIICLSGFEITHNASISANIFNIPVFYNNSGDYLNGEINNGFPLNNNIPLFVANPIQSFIKYPPFNSLYNEFLIFYKNILEKKSNEINNDNDNNNYLEYYKQINKIICN